VLPLFLGFSTYITRFSAQSYSRDPKSKRYEINFSKNFQLLTLKRLYLLLLRRFMRRKKGHTSHQEKKMKLRLQEKALLLKHVTLGKHPHHTRRWNHQTRKRMRRLKRKSSENL